ncbi:cell division transport system permease protein [Bacillus ectoiniformans]|uniref:permease-like cell division protein FtsX n=1 Tax=Bacillus ectoiniformans TaxID=1494429 RepID=UPI00195EF085|nr:permease-like cell division protein FtsX [Bacillus ectoiniformans]MBM7648786.1 cell division transport system permease protein [Bacillus ectoiniformans]
MKASTLRRHYRESFKNLRRNGWMTFAAVSAVTVTLLLVGVFLVVMLNMNKVATDIEKDVEVRVHVKLEASDADKKMLEQKIANLPEVDSVEYSSKEKELQNLIKDLGDDFALFEQNNPLYDVYIVKTKRPIDTPKAAKKIEKFTATEAAIYGEKKVEKLFDVLKTSRNVGLVLILGLLFTAMFLISNTIKITIFARRKEIEIMRLVGATNWFIRWPFILEGLWLGILGSVLPILAVVIGYRYVADEAAMRLQGEFIQLLDYFPFVLQVSGIIILIGAFIGMWGSFMSVRKFLKI